MSKTIKVKDNTNLVRSEKSGALLSTDSTKYLQRKNSKQARTQALASEQRIANLERQVARLQRTVSDLIMSKTTKQKKKD